jgi:hypothetical protein
MSTLSPQIEFRIPISPTRDFYQRVHFFCAALRRVDEGSAETLVRVVVGDGAALSEVRAENGWSSHDNVEWHGVPDEIFSKHAYHGTADFRYLLPDPAADLIVLADADTVLVKPIKDDFLWMIRGEPCIAAHMAHYPAPFKPLGRSELKADNLWPFLFQEFSIPWPETLYPYSLDHDGRFPSIPAYYNLGFVVLNRAALQIFRETIFPVEQRLMQLIDSNMRCQMAVTLISYQHEMQRQNLPAIYNAANDLAHLNYNRIHADEIKVIHYLRNDEIDRSFFLTDRLSHFLSSAFQNPVNQLLQKLAREVFSEELESSARNSQFEQK